MNCSNQLDFSELSFYGSKSYQKILWLDSRKIILKLSGIQFILFKNIVGLPSHPGHEIAKKQMKGFGGMVTFDIKGGIQAAKKLTEVKVESVFMNENKQNWSEI